MEQHLRGRHAVVTGGSRGIGAAVAGRLHALGARLTLMGRTESALAEQAASIPGTVYVTADVTSPASVQAAFQTCRKAHGPVGILVNNAGAAASAPFERLEETEWHRMLEVNLNSIFYCTREVLAGMRAEGWGRIINIASTAGIRGYPYASAYCAAKHGAVGLTRALALETARSGVTANAVCPGFTRTALLEDAIANIMEKTGRNRVEAETELRSANPQGRFIEPDEVAATVAWLCLPGSEGITGQAIAVAGGEVMA